MFDPNVHNEQIAFFQFHGFVAERVVRAPVQNVNQFDELVRVAVAAAVPPDSDRYALVVIYMSIAFQLHIRFLV